MEMHLVTARHFNERAYALPAVLRDRRTSVASLPPVTRPLPPISQRFQAVIDARDLAALKIGAGLCAALVGSVAAYKIVPAILGFVWSAL